MMRQLIGGAREMHAVRNVEDYHRKQKLAIDKKRRHGMRVEIHDGDPVRAYIDHGYWVADCECGAGNATDPDWGIALCFGCGAIHDVEFPEDREAIEAELLKRRKLANRNWLLHETVDDLRAQNAEHGVS